MGLQLVSAGYLHDGITYRIRRDILGRFTIESAWCLGGLRPRSGGEGELLGSVPRSLIKVDATVVGELIGVATLAGAPGCNEFVTRLS